MQQPEYSLAQDIEKMLGMMVPRRQALRWLCTGAATLSMAACGGAGGASDTDLQANTRASAPCCTVIARLRSSFCGHDV